MRRSGILACCAVLMATGALAHAVLVRASLDDSPVRAGAPTTVTLQFNTGIEPRLTRVLLVTEGGEERTLEHAPGDGPGRLAVTLPPLAAGRYALRYKVLGADGHVTDSVLRFRVRPSE